MARSCQRTIVRHSRRGSYDLATNDDPFATGYFPIDAEPVPVVIALINVEGRSPWYGHMMQVHYLKHDQLKPGVELRVSKAPLPEALPLAYI